jgi:DNA polymerase-1
MEDELHRRGLWEIYLERIKLIPIAWEMEQRGVTLSKDRLDELRVEYLRESYLASEKCIGIAKARDYDLVLPKAGNNKSLTEFCFNHLDLPVLKYTDTGNPSLDKATIEQLELTLPTDSEQHQFVTSLKAKRKRDTALQYMTGYERYMLNGFQRGWYILHPNLNITGTDTLRWSSTNPNEQNISKQEGFNLRYCFGPMRGREWWSLDFENLELRIPAYEAQEKDLMWVFEHPDDPPYYGSYHLVVFELLHPAEFKEFGKGCKERFKSTLYQWVKNGNFAIIYGAQERKADETYHVRGAYGKIQKRFPAISKLSAQVIAFANKHGFVETIPDQVISPKRGYPLLLTRTDYGEVEPTKPFNYHVSGSAMWCTARAMVRCNERLKEWKREDEFDSWIVMQVHDELVFDMPKGGRSNLPKVKALKGLMQRSGEDIGVPLSVAYTYHPNNWSKGEKV